MKKIRNLLRENLSRELGLPTPDELEIKAGRFVEYRRDDGTVSHHVASTGPEPATRKEQLLCGDTWVIQLAGVSGCVALNRCKPFRSRK
jgi:hypothetical protein